MPAPIVLNTLTPETKKVLNPPAGQPVIATKAELRDGTRVTEPVTPVDPGADPRDWQTILTRQGADTLGTDDPKINLDNILSYEGSFLIPQFKTGDNTFYGLNGWQSMTFKAPDGSNGPNGSIFIASFWYIAELQIPTLSAASDHSSLNPATILQNWVDMRPKIPSGDVNEFNKIGWMHCENGKLYVAPYAGYDTGGNSENIFICNDSSNLAGSTYSGAFQTWSADIGSRYICKIPAAKQSAFGNKTHFAGTGPEASIVSRTSLGHSLVGLNLADVAGTYQISDSITWAWYDGNNPINGYSIANGDIANYYGPLAWPDGAYNLLDYWPQSTLDAYGANLGGTDSKGLYGFAALPIVESGRPTTLHQYPLPPDSLRKHAVQYETVCGCAFIPPGTDSVVFIGTNEGSKYGQGYKTLNIDTGPPSGWDGVDARGGGFEAYDSRDKENFIWAMNLNDVAARVNTYDPQYQSYKPFQDPGPFAKSFPPYQNFLRSVRSGSYDEVNTRLYLGISSIPFSNFEDQAVVSVYQVGSGL